MRLVFNAENRMKSYVNKIKQNKNSFGAENKILIYLITIWYDKNEHDNLNNRLVIDQNISK